MGAVVFFCGGGGGGGGGVVMFLGWWFVLYSLAIRVRAIHVITRIYVCAMKLGLYVGMGILAISSSLIFFLYE